MSENKTENRINITNEVKKNEKTDSEIQKENEELNASLQGGEQLDPKILAQLKNKVFNEPKKKDRSLNFGVVGLGQAGNRIAALFQKLGYESVCFNTATQDLEFINLPEDKKVFLPFALGGAGKDLNNGQEAVDNNAELILKKLGIIFTDKQEMLLLCISGGGGTGAGGCLSMISLMSTLSKPIGVIYVLPMESEDSLAKHNSITALKSLAEMASSDVISTLIVVDNSKIELIYPNLSKAEFWDTANNAIIQPLHLFNYLSFQPTKYDSLDSMDFSRLFTTGDCTIYGMIEVENYIETTAIAEAIVENLESGLLASDFNLKETRFGGFIITGNSNALKNLPAININYASHMISEACNSPNLVNGVYEQPIDKDVIRVYTLFSGLGLPIKRIENLRNEAQEQMAILKEKEQTRTNKMSIDYGANSNSQNKAKEVHRLIQQKKTAFGKLTTNAGRYIKDRRKR